MSISSRIRKFILPSLTTAFLIRASLIAIFAYVFFGYICLPLRIKGSSMEPTYRNGGFNFCWTLHYVLSEPERHDVVAVRFAGNSVMLLKRVVALEGESLEFRSGRLFVEGKEIDEPYVRYPCDWNLPPQEVKKYFVYVVGDNRNVPIQNHVFGQTPIERIKGVPLW